MRVTANRIPDCITKECHLGNHPPPVKFGGGRHWTQLQAFHPNHAIDWSGFELDAAFVKRKDTTGSIVNPDAFGSACQHERDHVRLAEKLRYKASAIPSLRFRYKSAKQPTARQHVGEALHERHQPVLGHVRDQFVEHAALAEQ